MGFLPILCCFATSNLRYYAKTRVLPMLISNIAGLMLVLTLSMASVLLAAAEIISPTPQAALERLLSGNKRYAQDKLLHPNRDQVRREALTSQQSPFAIILGCSDSRVSPEIVFDQGIGDLFVVRVAGNVVGPIELDSIEYSVEYLNSSLIVLGHENCGAVNAVLSGKTKDIEAIAIQIEPAVEKSRGLPGNALENAVKANVKLVVDQIKKSETIARFIAEKKIGVVGGYYKLASGEIELCCGPE
jgi:carbonic anhydrase